LQDALPRPDPRKLIAGGSESLVNGIDKLGPSKQAIWGHIVRDGFAKIRRGVVHILEHAMVIQESKGKPPGGDSDDHTRIADADS